MNYSEYWWCVGTHHSIVNLHNCFSLEERIAPNMYWKKHTRYEAIDKKSAPLNIWHFCVDVCQLTGTRETESERKCSSSLTERAIYSMNETEEREKAVKWRYETTVNITDWALSLARETIRFGVRRIVCIVIPFIIFFFVHLCEKEKVKKKETEIISVSAYRYNKTVKSFSGCLRSFNFVEIFSFGHDEFRSSNSFEILPRENNSKLEDNCCNNLQWF